MLFVLFAVVVATILAAYYLIFERTQRRVAQQAASTRSLDSPHAALAPVPSGVFLQPTFTWSQMTPSGELLMGVHPLLLSLIGAPLEVEVVSEGRVEKGKPLFRVRRADRHFTLNSPVSGKISGALKMVDGETSWEHVTGKNRWLCRVELDQMEDEISTWVSGSRAGAWSEGQYARIKDHLLSLGAESEPGLTLADGGEVPAGALAKLGEEEWREFEEEFLRGSKGQ